MARRKYPIEQEGPDGWSRWVATSPEGEYRLGCCDCGLIHELQFRVKEGRIEFRASRNQRSTGQLRRQMIRRGEGIVANRRED